jgi:hypothetical protein
MGKRVGVETAVGVGGTDVSVGGTGVAGAEHDVSNTKAVAKPIAVSGML